MTFEKWLDLPPIWTFAFGLAMYEFSEFWPIGWFEAPGGILIPLILAVVAVGLMIWTAITFRQNRTTVVPHMPPSAIVTDGPLRLSRNPIYLGDALILIAWGIWLGAVSPFICLPLFVLLIEARFIKPEEARLMSAFPEDFTAYKARVRRWI